MTLYRLGDACRIHHGYAFRGEHMECSSDTTLPVVVNIGNFKYDGGFRFDSTKVQRYTGAFPEAFRLRGGDLLVVMTCQTPGGEILGIPGRIPDDTQQYLHNQRLGRAEITRPLELSLDYLRYLFSWSEFNKHLVATATGSKILHTAPGRIEDFRWQRPPIEAQRRIASVLSAYDDLIENNTRRIGVLEEMARVLYHHWFVSLDNQTLGKRACLSTVARVQRGRSYKGSELSEDDGLPFINLKCIDREGGFRRSGIKRFQGASKSSHQVSPGDIVVAVTDMTQERRIVARAGRVPRLDHPHGVFSMDLLRIDPIDPSDRLWLYGFLRYSGMADEVKQHANGANVLHLHPDRILSYEAWLPPAELRTRYGTFADPLWECCESLADSNERLRTARDLLLPKLLSGELSVDRIPDPAAVAP